METEKTPVYEQPLISVVVPVYNAERTLKRCLDSILRQTYQNTELILVDDGSTDGSPAMVDACAAAHPDSVRVIHKENGGLMRAWLDGVRKSRGGYLCFVDSDDWIDAEMVEKMAARLNREEERYAPGQIVCCGWLYEYSDRPPAAGEHVLREGVYTGAKLDKELKSELLGHEQRRITFSRCLKLIARELITDNIRFLDPSIRFGEDANIMVPVLLDAHRVAIMHDPFYHYLFVENSMAHHYDARTYEDCVKLRKQLLSVIEVKGILREEDVQREFLFLFFQVIKAELRRDDAPHAARKAIRRIRELCRAEKSDQLLSVYPHKLRSSANRLIAPICKKPSAIRILLARSIFWLQRHASFPSLRSRFIRRQ